MTETMNVVWLDSKIYESMLRGLLFYSVDSFDDEGVLWGLNRLMEYWEGCKEG